MGFFYILKVFLKVFFRVFKGFLGFVTYKCRTQDYDPQGKIRPYERHKMQFIFEYHLY